MSSPPGLYKPQMRSRAFQTLFLAASSALAIFWITGCSTFDRDWQAAAKFPREPGDIQGPWQGTWLSDTTKHTDRLRCIISKTDVHTYQARFKAHYRKVLTFGYSVPLETRPVGDGFRFKGEADLGWLAGGLYEYEGSADGTNFFSTYFSKYDKGTFRMGRSH
jgi:hypothetical protein